MELLVVATYTRSLVRKNWGAVCGLDIGRRTTLFIRGGGMCVMIERSHRSCSRGGASSGLVASVVATSIGGSRRAAETSEVATAAVSAAGVPAAALGSVGGIATTTAAVEASIGGEQSVTRCKAAFIWVAVPHVCQSRVQMAPRDKVPHHEKDRNYSTTAVLAALQQGQQQGQQQQQQQPSTKKSKRRNQELWCYQFKQAGSCPAGEGCKFYHGR